MRGVKARPDFELAGLFFSANFIVSVVSAVKDLFSSYRSQFSLISLGMPSSPDTSP